MLPKVEEGIEGDRDSDHLSDQLFQRFYEKFIPGGQNISNEGELSRYLSAPVVNSIIQRTSKAKPGTTEENTTGGVLGWWMVII